MKGWLRIMHIGLQKAFDLHSPKTHHSESSVKSQDVKVILQAAALRHEVSNSRSDMGHQHHFEGQRGHVKTSFIAFFSFIKRLATCSRERPSASIGSLP